MDIVSTVVWDAYREYTDLYVELRCAVPDDVASGTLEVLPAPTTAPSTSAATRRTASSAAFVRMVISIALRPPATSAANAPTRQHKGSIAGKGDILRETTLWKREHAEQFAGFRMIEQNLFGSRKGQQRSPRTVRHRRNRIRPRRSDHRLKTQVLRHGRRSLRLACRATGTHRKFRLLLRLGGR